jgi:hypothetical protein
MTTVNPQSVVVNAEIDLHTAIKALQEFAEKYPAERISIDQIETLDRAVGRLHVRLMKHFQEINGHDAD